MSRAQIQPLSESTIFPTTHHNLPDDLDIYLVSTRWASSTLRNLDLPRLSTSVSPHDYPSNSAVIRASSWSTSVDYLPHFFTVRVLGDSGSGDSRWYRPTFRSYLSPIELVPKDSCSDSTLIATSRLHDYEEDIRSIKKYTGMGWTVAAGAGNLSMLVTSLEVCRYWLRLMQPLLVYPYAPVVERFISHEGCITPLPSLTEMDKY